MAALLLSLLVLLCGAPLLPCAAQRGPENLAEIDALTSFRLNLQDPLGALNGWDSSTPAAPCDWRGVFCDNSSRVSELRLPRLQLGGRLSDHLAKLRMLAKQPPLQLLQQHHTLFALRCTRLRAVFLQNNSLTGKLPPEIGNLTGLQILNVATPAHQPLYNQFSGQVPASFGELQQLQFLWLDHNFLEGTLPSAIANCSALVHLSVEGNALGGVIPAAIAALPKLQVVSLSQNNFSGMVPSSLFCNVSFKASLKIVQLGFNSFTDIVKPKTTTCLSALVVLDLQHNLFAGDFPWWLTQVPNLTVLDVSSNSFSGVVPPRLETSRGENQFSGSIPPSFGNLSRLETLSLRGNHLTGTMPMEMLMGLVNLTTLDLSGNKFFGEVAISIGSLSQLMVLNLSGNGFSGRVPTSLGSLFRLTTIDLSKQNLSGEVPSELLGLPNLQVIALQENRLSGDVPEGFSSLVGLHYLNLSSNAFSGHIPENYGFLRSLVVLSLSNNHISGSIPPDLGNCSDLQVLELQLNSLTGTIPADLSNLSSLNELDLGSNNLTGGIPEEISKCSSLTALFLDSNHLSGGIPDSLSKLLNLTTLDLSNNNLSGQIPDDLGSIPGLVNVNVSMNNLEGEIPVMLGSRFNNASDFSGNPNLCGQPLDKKCKDLDKNDRKKRLILLIVIAVSGSCLLALCCCFYIFSLLRWRKKLKQGSSGEKTRSSARASSGTSEGRGSSDSGVPKLVMFNSKITLAETIAATRQFDEENVLSRTQYGLVFKACYDDGMVMSIRRLPDATLDENLFRKEAESLGRVKHRNLTVLRGYYAGPPDLRLLIYDYMPNGNLATLLQEASHQDGHVLNWPMRHLIALGIARGLAFLHTSSLVHGDVKPQSVLFDADFEAHLSDFGLDRLTLATSTTTPAEASSSTTVGTLGYVSPEATLTGRVTKESDVYSYGIVLLELLTGKRPVMFTEDEDIVKVLAGVKVGLLCTAPDPQDRPTMSDIVFMLEGCRVGPDLPSSADPTTQPSPA
ncbi:hypothetical protein M0R45_026746 [Rubus argutus]|uniref:Protein kinase domain-containing protein n=1 Tax=Rubus argutus TaxID=59490 RepID=A0AAW1WYH1_RUBAR